MSNTTPSVADALREYANPLNWDTDVNGIRRVWREPGSTTPDAFNGFELARAALSAARDAQAVPDGIPLNIIRKWPDGFNDRLQHVWLDVVSFIPSVKLYDLQRVLAEFGLRMEVYEDAPAAPQPAQQGDARVTLPDDIERTAVNRYRPVPSGVLAYKVVAGDGYRSLFSGTKDECQIVARKLTEAFLDGAHVALTAQAQEAAPAAQGEPAVSAGDALPTVHRTAPERIYLCIGDEAEQRDAPFDELADITWSHDQSVDVTVPYVRADLASATAPLLARIAEIEAELEKTKAIFAASCNHAAVMEMDRDARRYRWLRARWGRIADEYDGDSNQLVAIRESDSHFEGWDVEPARLDRAIDAAIAKAEGSSDE